MYCRWFPILFPLLLLACEQSGWDCPNGDCSEPVHYEHVPLKIWMDVACSFKEPCIYHILQPADSYKYTYLSEDGSWLTGCNRSVPYDGHVRFYILDANENRKDFDVDLGPAVRYLERTGDSIVVNFPENADFRSCNYLHSDFNMDSLKIRNFVFSQEDVCKNCINEDCNMGMKYYLTNTSIYGTDSITVSVSFFI